MLEEDKLFNFLMCSQNWAQIEIQRQGEKDLASAIIVPEALVHLRSSLGNDGEKVKSKPMKKKAGKGLHRKPYARHAKYDKPKSNAKATGGPSSIKTVGYFICDGPHQTRDYPKREKLDVLVTDRSRK